MKITVTVKDQVAPVLERLREIPGELDKLNAGMAMAGEALIVNHLRTRVAPRGNKLGAPSTGYWQRVAESVDARSDSSSATIAIRHRGAALHYHGGTVVPVRKEWLTIPVHPAAHGKHVGDFPKGTIFRLRGKRVLARKMGDRTLQILFALSKATRHQPDPTRLPTRQEIVDTASRTANRFLERRLAK